MEIKELAEYSPVPLSEQMLVQLERDCELLLEWNEKINLTALRTRDDIYEKHFLDCLLPIALI
ncbi:RsmG family class I SAM-dependent methyltransferase, partial [Galactobacillus timonensis]